MTTTICCLAIAHLARAFLLQWHAVRSVRLAASDAEAAQVVEVLQALSRFSRVEDT